MGGADDVFVDPGDDGTLILGDGLVAAEDPGGRAERGTRLRMATDDSQVAPPVAKHG